MYTTKQLYSRKHISFLLFDVLNIADLSRLDYFKDHSRESYNLVLDSAAVLAQRIDATMVMEADRKPPELVNGKVTVHPGLHDYVKGFSQAGFIAASFSNDLGGFQLPKTMAAAIDYILCCSSNSFIMYTDLAKGIANLISTYGTDEQKVEYLPNIFSGKWLGTMCLTETESGSSLADIKTAAYPMENGSYRIKGQKIFISAGDHDITENIIHLVLARIQGAPPGTKGISLFIVPKQKEDGTGNDVTSIGLYHKMGQKATPALHLEFGANDDCVGYLLGEANKGLKHMFLMMDNARLGVGSMGVGTASAAYHIALQYAHERKQGRRLNDTNPNSGQTEIINHPDVRSMLLQQKAFVEGTLGFILQCYTYLDIQKHTDDDNERKKCTRLLNLLTPVAKTYGAEKGVISVNQALQVLGGYGYTEDFPLEQLARDVRILPIYEGTTGIHSLGLLGRQVLADGGHNLEVWYSEVETVIAQALPQKAITLYAELLSRELNSFRKITEHIKELTKDSSPEVFLADATLYMEFFGILNVAWQWLKQGVTVQNHSQSMVDEDGFYESKMLTLNYFFEHELPKLKGLSIRLLNKNRSTISTGGKELLI